MSFLSDKYSYFFFCFAIILAIWISFIPCLEADFVNWDDPIYIYDNPVIENFEIGSLQAWKDVFLDFNSEVSYAPLTSLTFAIEKEFFGFENPQYWHLDSLVLHIVVSLLVFALGIRIGLSPIFAVLLAMFFGVHPMKVESVAWLTERKDTLYAFFYFSAILVYIGLRRNDHFSKMKYSFVLVLFVLSLLSKIQAVTLPISLLLIDYLIDQKFEFNQIWNKIPFLVISFVMGMIGILYTTGAEPEAVVRPDIHHSTMWVCTTMWVYLYKVFVPYPLLPIYPFPDVFARYEYASLLIPPFGLYFLYNSWEKKYYLVFFGLAFFAVNILFTLPVIPLGQGYAADRFTYVAYFGLFLVLIERLEQVQKHSKLLSYLSLGIMFAFVLTLGALTYNQCKVWNNSETLWTHQLSFTDNLPSVYKNRATHYRDHKFLRVAETDIDVALELDPNDISALIFKGELLLSYGQKKYDKEALEYYNRIIILDPRWAPFYANRAIALARLNRIEEAIEDLNTSINLNPDGYDAYKNRAILYERMGMLNESISDIETYLGYNPQDDNIWGVKAKIHAAEGDYQSALSSINRAISLNNQLGVYFFEKGVILYNSKDYMRAKKMVEQGIHLGYNDQIELAQKILEMR